MYLFGGTQFKWRAAYFQVHTYKPNVTVADESTIGRNASSAVGDFATNLGSSFFNEVWLIDFCTYTYIPTYIPTYIHTYHRSGNFRGKNNLRS